MATTFTDIRDPEHNEPEYEIVFDHLMESLRCYDRKPENFPQFKNRDEYGIYIIKEFLGSAVEMLRRINAQPRLEVEYFPSGEPNLTWPDGLMDLVRVDYVDGQAQHLRYLEHNGVTVYRTLDDLADLDDVADYWLSTSCPACSDWDSSFDVRDMPRAPKSINFNPEVDQTDENKMAVAWAIEIGNLTQEGYDQDAYYHVPEGEPIILGDERFSLGKWEKVSVLAVGEPTLGHELVRRPMK